MPCRPNTPCKHPGCGSLVPYGTMYCEEHKPLHQHDRKTTAEKGYGSRWQKARAVYLQSHPFCVRCLAKGRYVKATVVDHIIPHLHRSSGQPEGPSSQLRRTTMLVLAVTLHNIPEGMAVGVTFAGAMTGNGTLTLAGAFALSVGIAIQNFPEGAIISMPLKGQGISRTRAFAYGTLSGIVEPAAAFFTILLTGLVVPFLPYLLAFAAGAMIYVVVEELIPEAQTGAHSNIGTVGVALGFALMMILDVALG